MAYDEHLAERIRDLLADRADLDEKQMFGGLAFLVAGNMAVAVSGQGGLMVRVEPDDYEALLARGPAEPVDMGGRTMGGWVRVAAPALGRRTQLERWVGRGVARAASLPPK